MPNPGPSVSEFISRLDDGLQFNNRYRMEFTLPMGIIPVYGTNFNAAIGLIQMQDVAYNYEGKINMFCHTVSLPGRTLDTHRLTVGAAPHMAPNSQSYESITVSFYTDNKMNTRKYFELWQSAIVNIGSNTFNYWDEFVSDIKLYLFDREGNKGSYSITFYECYPIQLADADLTYQPASDVLSITVMFSYKYWQASNDPTPRGK